MNKAGRVVTKASFNLKTRRSGIAIGEANRNCGSIHRAHKMQQSNRASSTVIQNRLPLCIRRMEQIQQAIRVRQLEVCSLNDQKRKRNPPTVKYYVYMLFRRIWHTPRSTKAFILRYNALRIQWII